MCMCMRREEKRRELREERDKKKEEKQRMGRYFLCMCQVPRSKVFSEEFFIFWFLVFWVLKPNWKEPSCRVTTFLLLSPF